MEHMKEKLLHIPSEFQPIPFWSWNDKLEPAELRKQIRWMKKNGIGGFFMHARGGLNTKYMSEEWMECIEECCDEAEANGMTAWGYDENGWPSGFGGGKLLEEMENRERYLEYQTGDFDENADVSYYLGEEELVRVQEKITDGEYLNLYIRCSVSTVDILNPKIVRKFIDITHEKYKERLGDKFSEKFKGFFTDEPQFYRGGGTPYSPMTIPYFQEHYEEDLLDGLGLLFVKKKGWRRFRYRYWLAMQRLMLQSFAMQIYNWCEENHVQLTGHYIEENTMGHQVSCCGGIMPFYAYMHIPGIDWIIGDTELELGPRQVGSVARQMGRKHVLTETFAARGWNCTPEELRRIAGFQYVNGVNFMCHHLIPYTEHGQRKRDFPIHFTPVNPWVKEKFRDFNDYFTRLGYLLSTGEEAVHVAMLHPVRSTYFEYRRDMEAAEFGLRDIERKLQETMRIFSSRGIAYHFLDETLLEDYGFVTDTQIGCGKCAYDYLVLPCMETMGTHTEQLIRTYVENGGRILLMDKAPQYLEGESYDYTYLKSNCTLDEILLQQPFTVEHTDNRLYYAYRLVEDTPFLFIQNASDTNCYTQTVKFKDEIQSLIAFNPVTLEENRLPLTFQVQASESLLLFPDKSPVEEKKPLLETNVRFCNAEVEFDENYMPLDEIRFSKDGVHYSNPVYVNTLFEQLLEERYNGKLWIQYSFYVETLPESVGLMAEKDNAHGATINGYPVTFSKRWKDDSSFYLADISKFVRQGDNVYEIEMDWHQKEETYYALFGENVTETLKNCIVYESEIEAVYLYGKFGVYSRKKLSEFQTDSFLGYDFYIGATPERITELVTDGFPFFRGKIQMRREICLESKNILLHVDGNYLTALVRINGQYAGELLFSRQLDISDYAVKGDNLIEVEFVIGNRNLFGPLHLAGPECCIRPFEFSLCDLPRGENDVMQYRLHRFYD